MSFFITKHYCKRCNGYGYYEVWEHDESGNKHIHRFAFKYTNHDGDIVCLCEEPQEKDKIETSSSSSRSTVT